MEIRSLPFKLESFKYNNQEVLSQEVWHYSIMIDGGCGCQSKMHFVVISVVLLHRFGHLSSFQFTLYSELCPRKNI